MRNASDLVVNAQLTLKDHLDLLKASPFRRIQWLLLAIGLIYVYFAFAELLNNWNHGVEIFTVALYVFVALFAAFGATNRSSNSRMATFQPKPSGKGTSRVLGLGYRH